MTGTIFEQNQTFADDIEYKREEPEYTVEQEEQAVEEAAQEINPPLVYAKDEGVSGQSPEDRLLALAGQVSYLQSKTIVVEQALDRISEMINGLVKVLDSLCTSAAGLHMVDMDVGPEILIEEDDRDIQPEKKHKPGRPVRREPKVKVKKKIKAVAKKAVPRKPKTVKKKTKR